MLRGKSRGSPSEDGAFVPAANSQHSDARKSCRTLATRWTAARPDVVRRPRHECLIRGMRLEEVEKKGLKRIIEVMKKFRRIMMMILKCIYIYIQYMFFLKEDRRSGVNRRDMVMNNMVFYIFYGCHSSLGSRFDMGLISYTSQYNLYDGSISTIE